MVKDDPTRIFSVALIKKAMSVMAISQSGLSPCGKVQLLAIILYGLLFPWRKRLQCIQDSALPVIHCHGQGRHCCWRCHGRSYCLQEVLKTALVHHDLAHEICEAAKALDKRQAHLCVFASNCDVKLVEALCVEHQISLIKVDGNKKLREWVGLCKTDRERKPP